MSKKSEHLREALSGLHDELESAGDLDHESRKVLRAAAEEIQAKLLSSSPDLSGTAPGRWSDQLQRSIQDFEESHPDLVTALGRVADALSNVGL